MFNKPPEGYFDPANERLQRVSGPVYGIAPGNTTSPVEGSSGGGASLKIYLLGSLRNPIVPHLGVLLRKKGHDVFDEWHGTGPDADDKWKEYEAIRGRNYREALAGYAAQMIFNFDKHHIDEADVGIMVMPAGKSGHMELGYMIGQGKKGYIYFDKEPEPDRYEVMHNFATGLVIGQEELIEVLKK